jgi:hypothetical protein
VLLSWFAVGDGFVVLCCICCFSLCSKEGGKFLDVAMLSMVCHSLSCHLQSRCNICKRPVCVLLGGQIGS